ncbi:MAG: hypothetical protein FWC36_05100 [Spirochaetes bacterium]|nr:hypothetical protein [Spirochaetota bacterium]
MKKNRSLLFVSILILSVLLSCILLSCSNRDRFLEEFERAMNESQTQEQLLAALLELDKRYPKKLRTKIHIAAIYFAMDKPDLAELFLARGVEAARTSRERDEKYFFYANYADFLFNIGDLSRSLEMGLLALENDDSDPAGISLLIAQILMNERRNTEALFYFKRAWETNIDIFTEEDLIAFFYLLSLSQDAEENVFYMISVLDELRLRNPNIRGYGFKQAEILRQAGAHVASLIAIFSEIEFLRTYTHSNNMEVLRGLDILSEENRESLLSVKIIEGYKSFIREEWSIAEAIFAEITPEVPIVFYNYLRLASMLQLGLGTEELFTKFLLLGRYYSELQGYYYNFWNGIKRSPVEFDTGFIESVLRNCILISPYSDYARLSRIELGRLFNVPQGERIVLIDEVFYYVNSVINGASPDILEPVALMLEMDNNIFIDDAMMLLREAVIERRIGAWFENRAQRGNEIFRARISALMP